MIFKRYDENIRKDSLHDNFNGKNFEHVGYIFVQNRFTAVLSCELQNFTMHLVEIKWTICEEQESIKCQCCPHIGASQLICQANQLTGFSMRVTLGFNGLNIVVKACVETHSLFCQKWQRGVFRTLSNIQDKDFFAKQFTIFTKKLHPRCLTEFLTRLWVNF